MQKLPAPDFTATTKVKLTTDIVDKNAGLIIMGGDYSYLTIRKTKDAYSLSQVICKDAERGGEEKEFDKKELKGNTVYLRIKLTAPLGQCTFSYSLDGQNFTPIGQTFLPKPDKWIGAKVGIFCNAPFEARNGGYADFDWFRIER